MSDSCRQRMAATDRHDEPLRVRCAVCRATWPVSQFPDRRVRIESEPAEASRQLLDDRTGRPARSRARRVEGLHLPRREQENAMKVIVQDTYGSPDVQGAM